MSEIMGVVNIQTFDKKGNLIDMFEEKNKILDVGIAAIWQRTARSDGSNAHQMATLCFGDDYGEGEGSQWSIFNPQPAHRGFTEKNQNITHTVSKNAINFDYPTDDSLRVSSVIDGTSFMNQFFSDQIDYRYTSMTLRFKNGTPWAFKRFPIKSISREVVVKIDWTFFVINQKEWCSNEQK